MSDIVNKLWGMCHTLRHDGIDYGGGVDNTKHVGKRDSYLFGAGGK